MNAIAPVPHFQPSSDASQFKPSSDADSSANALGGQDFSSALHAQNSKPARKSAADRSSQGSQGGNPSPAGGNPPPSALPPASPPPVIHAKVATPPPSGPAAPPVTPAPTTVTPPAAAATTAGAAALQPDNGTTSQNPNATGAAAADSGDAVAPAPGLGGQGPSQLPTTAATNSAPAAAVTPTPLVLPPDATPMSDTNPDTAVSSKAAALAATAADATTSAAATVAAAKSAAATSAPATAMLQTIAQGATPTATKASAPSQGNQPTHSIRSSALDPNGTPSSGTAAATTTDATAQTAVAAAAAAARIGDGTDSDDPASQDQLATPDIGPKLPAVAPTMLAPVAAAPAGSPAAVTTAVNTALANARTINALSNVNTAIEDKSSRDGNSDAPLISIVSDGSVGAAQLLTTNTTTDAATTPTFKVAAPVETADFSQGVADRVSFMVDGNISSAKLQVSPPALGPIEVRIALQGSHAQVSFTSHSALTRDALESSAPQLRDMLSSQGFGQVSVDVSHGSFQDRSAQSSPYQSSAVAARDSSLDAAQTLERINPRVPAGVVDDYA